MDLEKIIVELRLELSRVDAAILAVEEYSRTRIVDPLRTHDYTPS